MNRLKTIFLLAILGLTTNTFATTWDEPWMDKVIREAEYFVFAKVKSNSEKKGVTIEIVKSLAGPELSGKIKIKDFYLLDLCSYSGGHGPEFHFESFKECYFFLKKNKSGQYCIATPSTGFALFKDGGVYATYRHSYHQALVEPEIYEKTMTAIFNHYHNLPYDNQFVNNHIKKYLSLPPAKIEESEIKTFFNQHVALECAYHLRLSGYYKELIPFLADTSNFHNQVSAARAMISYNTTECKQELLNLVSDSTRNEFVKVICVWTLTEFKPTELKSKLSELYETASSESNDFGGNIMDPRVCTNLPSVKKSIETLIETI